MITTLVKGSTKHEGNMTEHRTATFKLLSFTFVLSKLLYMVIDGWFNYLCSFTGSGGKTTETVSQKRRDYAVL